MPFRDILLRHIPPPWTPSCTSPPVSLAHFCSPLPRKSLKVVDLKDILSKANVALTGKANKPDLIAKILASPEAIEVYNQNYGPAPDTPAQNASAAPQNTEAVRHSFLSSSLRSTVASRRVLATTTTTETVRPPLHPLLAPHSPRILQNCPIAVLAKCEGGGSPGAVLEACFQGRTETSKRHSLCARACLNDTVASKQDNAAAAAKPSDTQTPVTADAKKTAEDEEAEKRKARAARFGIPLVEPTVANGKSPGKGAGKGAGKVAGKVKGAPVAEVCMCHVHSSACSHHPSRSRMCILCRTRTSSLHVLLGLVLHH